MVYFNLATYYSTKGAQAPSGGTLAHNHGKIQVFRGQKYPVTEILTPPLVLGRKRSDVHWLLS